MTDLNQLKNYLGHLVANIEDLKTPFVVFDDKQLPRLLKDLKESENLIVMGIMPSYITDATSSDDAVSRDLMSFLVLKKADRDIKHSEFLLNMQRCLIAAKEVRKLIISDMQNYQDGCSFLTMLNVHTIKIDPIIELAGTDGYEIHFNTITTVD